MKISKEQLNLLPDNQAKIIVNKVNELLEIHAMENLNVKTEQTDTTIGIDTEIWLYNKFLSIRLVHIYDGKSNEEIQEKYYLIHNIKKALELMESAN